MLVRGYPNNVLTLGQSLMALARRCTEARLMFCFFTYTVSTSFIMFSVQSRACHVTCPRDLYHRTCTNPFRNKKKSSCFVFYFFMLAFKILSRRTGQIFVCLSVHSFVFRLSFLSFGQLLPIPKFTSNSLKLSIILLLSGDISLNPGPEAKNIKISTINVQSIKCKTAPFYRICNI